MPVVFLLLRRRVGRVSVIECLGHRGFKWLAVSFFRMLVVWGGFVTVEVVATVGRFLLGYGVMRDR